MNNKKGQEILLSLVIPVYNYESKLYSNLNSVVEELKKKQFSFEVILVNDGSTDRTEAVIKKISEIRPEIKPISYNRNRGKGYAVRKGILAATGRIIFFTDVDLPYGLEPIFKGLELIDKQGFDIVLGSRDLPESKGISFYNWKRKIFGKIFSLLANFILSLGISDTQCGLKGFKREVAKTIFSQLTRNDFSFDVEVLYLARKKRFNIKLIPVHLNHPMGTSTVSLIGDPLKMFGGIFAIKYNDIIHKYH